MSSLSFAIADWDGDDLIALIVSVSTERFSGYGTFWVPVQDVIRFRDSLSTYPIDPKNPLKARWGYGTLEGEDLIIGIEIAPANGKGDLRILVEIADEHDRQERVRTSFLVNYPELGSFSVSIARLMDHQEKSAVLTGQ